MQVLVVAEDNARRAALARALRAGGHDVCGEADAPGVMQAVRRDHPDALLLEGGGDAMLLREVLERARQAAEAPLPVVLLVPEHSVWQRGLLPADLLPARVLGSLDAEPGRLASALAEIAVGREVASQHSEVRGRHFRLDRVQREVEGPRGVALLTPSEVSVLWAIVEGGGGVVLASRVAASLWVEPVVDPHARAAIRSHVHTLRRKLKAIGLHGLLITVPGVGYRLGEVELPSRA